MLVSLSDRQSVILLLLSTPKYLTDSNRPKSFTKIVNTLYDSVEDVLLRRSFSELPIPSQCEWCVLLSKLPESSGVAIGLGL
jgi:hypothetical protein